MVLSERIGYFRYLAKLDRDFDDDDLLLAEYGATVFGMEILRDNSQKIEVEA